MSEERLFSKLDNVTPHRNMTDVPPGTESSAPDSGTDSLADSAVTFKDMDNDGDLDIVVSPHNGQSDYWLANDLGSAADVIFSQPAFATIIPTAIAVGDVDNDGTQDMVIGHLSGAKVFHNNGDWDMKTVSSVLHHPNTIYLEDVNQDGQTDIVVRDSRELTLIQGVLGTFGAMIMTWPNLGDSSLLAIGNFDITNSTLEILTLDANTGCIGMVTSDSNSWQAIQTVSSVEVSSFIIADLNFDGYDDIYIEDGEGNIVWMEGDGTGDLIYHEDDSLLIAGTDEIDDEIILSESGNDIVISEGADPDTENVETDDLSEDMLAEDVNYIELTLNDLEGTLAQLDLTTGVLDLSPMDNPNDMPPPEETWDYSGSDKGVNTDLDNGPPPPPRHLFGPDPEMVKHLIGSAFDDYLHGDNQANKLIGGEGRDKLFGGDGHDSLLGGDGQDLLFGENGNDFMAGQRGDDLLFGDFGNDTMFGGEGKDILFGHTGKDILHGGIGNDFLSGGEDDDFLYGGLGRDTMVGDHGRDIFHYKSVQEGGDIIRGFENGKDMLTFEFGSRTLHKVISPYDGDLGIEGDGFIMERTGEFSCRLYYDKDTSAAGDEWLIAEIEGMPAPEDAPDGDHLPDIDITII